MEPDLVPVIAIVGGVLGIAGLIGAALAVLRTNLVKGTLELYKENDRALKGRISVLEDENRSFERHVAELEGKLAALKEERQVLRDLATGASAIENLRSEMVNHHRELVSLLTKITEDRRSTDS